MPEKTKETPLHDVVLKIMFEENKKKPAQLLPSEILNKIKDAAVTEFNIIEVLNWLASHERVEKALGKYSLDRYEFLDQRKIDNEKNSPKTGKSTNKKGAKPAKEEEVPLHDVILQLMFDANKEEPAELTLNDVFWMTSDSSLLEPQVGDVLNWLVHHRRVEYRDGKYSLDRFEFLDQAKVNDALEKPKAKQTSKQAKTPKPAAEVKPKIVIPPAPKESKAPKKEVKPKPAVTEKKPITPKVKETVAVPAPPRTPVPKKKEPISKPVEAKTVEAAPKVEKPIKVQEAVNTNHKLTTAMLIIAACFFMYSCYLFISLSTSVNPDLSDKLQEEIVSAQSELKELSEGQTNQPIEVKALERKLTLLDEVATKRFEQQDVQNRNAASNRSITQRLLISNGLILLIFGFLFFKVNGKRAKIND